MTKQKVFSGCATAIATPFKDGKIDYESMDRLIDFQIDNGIDAIVLLGTTGEAPTISEDERSEVIKFTKERIKNRIPLIVGTGTNSTESTIRYSKNAHVLGANAILCVSPYYNKPSKRGLVEHFCAVAKSVDIPLILYNVPSRTGQNIPLDVYTELAKIPNIVGVKEASGSLSYFADIKMRCGEELCLYSGNDDITLPTLAMGAQGVISVASNVVPRQMHQLTRAFFEGDNKRALEMQLYLLPLIREIFSESNPIPVKEFLCQMGLCRNEYRLPLCESERREDIEKIIKYYKI